MSEKVEPLTDEERMPEIVAARAADSMYAGMYPDETHEPSMTLRWNATVEGLKEENEKLIGYISELAEEKEIQRRHLEGLKGCLLSIHNSAGAALGRQGGE